MRAAKLAFLPLGADLNTAVYRATTDLGSTYFLKLRRGPFAEMTVAIPAFLGDQGMREIIVPQRTTAGQLWHRWEPVTVTLYPFVEGSEMVWVARNAHSPTPI